MKKHLHKSLRALFLYLAVLLSLPMQAVEIEIDGINYNLNAEAKQAAVIAKNSGKYSGEVVIPESVEFKGIAHSVTGIWSEAFKYCSVLTSVTIPNSVESIGERAFEGCLGLTSVTIPNSVTRIGNYAFSSCSGLISVTIGNSVTRIGNDAFSYCDGLTSLTIGNSVEIIGASAFEGCSGLTSITIPNSVTSIWDEAFEGCSGLTSVTIGNGVESIGKFAFYDCSRLTSVAIGNSVEIIGERAFYDCSRLTSVHISDIAAWCNIDFRGDYASSNPLAYARYLYLNGEEVRELVIPHSVTSIGRYAFYNLSRLISVTIPNSVKSIGGYALRSCSGLTSVTIGNSVTSIGEYAFYYCPSLTSVTIPNSVKSIGRNTFEYCSGLTSVTIGNSVKSIGKEAFRDCPELIDVYCYAENVPSTESDAFIGSYPEYATLYVPHTSIEDYKKEAPWSTFGTIKAIPGTERYTITFMLEGTEFHKDTLVAGSSITLPEAPEKEGHSFNGWKDVPETMPANDIVIIGSYSVNKYLLTFKIGDEVLSADSVEYGAKIETPVAPEKEGHTFNGWKDVPETMPANDIVIVGSYSVNKYLLTFKIGDEVIASDSIEYGAKVDTPQVAEKEGHTFNGWKDVPETMPANDIVVVGSYTVDIYKVYYYVGDELVHTDEVAYGESIPAYEYTPTNGDKFMGWEGEQYDTMPAHDVTYIANIESGILYINGDMSEYQIYDLNGRKIENAKSLKSGVYIVNGKKTIVKAN